MTDLKQNIINIINNISSVNDLKHIEQYLLLCYVNHHKSYRSKYSSDEERYQAKLEQNKKSYWKNRTPEKLERYRLYTYNRRHNLRDIPSLSVS